MTTIGGVRKAAMNASLIPVAAFLYGMLLDNAALRAQSAVMGPRRPSQISDLRHLKRTALSGIAYPMRAVIGDSAAFRDLWERARNRSDTTAVPAVDFNRNIVIAAAMGFRPMLDGDIRIEAVNVTDAVVRVRVTTTVLEDGSTVGAEAGYPLDMVEVRRPKAYGVVTFVEEYRPQ